MPFNNAVDASQSGYQSITSVGVWNGRTFQAGTGISLTNADGTAGNTTITATGMVPDPFGTVYLVDDFIFSSVAITAQTGDTNWESSGTTSHAGEAQHPGFIRIGSSGASGSLLKPQTAGSNGAFVLGAGILTAEFLVRITATSTHTYCVGLGVSTAPNEPTDGVYFLYASGTNSGNWVGKTANASSRSSANSTNAVVSNQWDRLKIIVNAAATSVSFYVNGVQIANSPLATNIPTANIYPLLSKTAGAGGESIDIDLFVISYVLTTPR